MGERANTPGPWLLELDNFGDYTVLRQNETLAIAAVVNGEMRRMGGHSGEHEANALLIAAAPDLLEALRLVKELYAYNGPDADGFAAMVERRIDAALAKASPHV